MQKAKVRREQNVFVVEGIKMFLEAPIELIENVYLAEQLWQSEKSDILQAKLNQLEAHNISCEVVADNVFKSVSDTQTPQGVICVVRQQEFSLEQMLEVENPLFIVLEDLQDPGNLGTIMRTAEGAGVTGVIMSRNTVDLYNPKTIRSTMGSIFRVPHLYTEDLISTVQQLQKNNVKVYAAHLMNSKDYVEVSYIEGTAFLIGNEGNGLTDELSRVADAYIKIPMQGQVESLNAAVAAALVMYEAYRQRR